MGEQVFVKVVGFTDVERHALNTLFRLSQEQGASYVLWDHDAPAAPRLVLADGQAYQALLELEFLPPNEPRLIWMGEPVPQRAWRSFQRPLFWPEVVQAMDELFVPAAEVDLVLDVDVDVELGPDTQPPDTRSPELERRALIIAADRDERLYLRAKLALAGLTRADEAETAGQAFECLRAQRYEVAFTSFGLPDAQGWPLLATLAAQRDRVRHVIATKPGASLPDRARGWWAGAAGLFEVPPDPAKLGDLLLRLQEERSA